MTSLADLSERDFEAIIVGSGATGSAMAAYLAEGGKRCQPERHADQAQGSDAAQRTRDSGPARQLSFLPPTMLPAIVKLSRLSSSDRVVGAENLTLAK